jgi:putative phage-type endonuclease
MPLNPILIKWKNIMEQQTDEWFKSRLGKATASRISDIIAKTKTGYSTSRANYMAELICERLTGSRGDFYKNAAMEWGTATEPQARSAYEAAAGVLVTEVGFVPHSTLTMAGASPDGLVGDDGLVEIKCPITATHIETLLGSNVPSKYNTQMQWQMACTGRKWCDLVSYDPRLPEHMQLFMARVPRDEVYIQEITKEVTAFLAELDAKIDELNKTYGVK